MVAKLLLYPVAAALLVLGIGVAVYAPWLAAMVVGALVWRQRR